MSRAAKIDLNRANCLEIRRGESPYVLRLQFLDPNNQPIDFTGCQGKSQIQSKEGVTIADFVVTFPGGGWVHLVLAQTEMLTPTRTASYDLFITYSNNERRCEAEGVVEIVDRVTEP